MAEKQTRENSSFFSIEAEQFVTSVEKLQKLCGRGWEGGWVGGWRVGRLVGGDDLLGNIGKETVVTISKEAL